MIGFACLLPMIVFVVTAEYLGVPLPGSSINFFTWMLIHIFAQHVNEDSLFINVTISLM